MPDINDRLPQNIPGPFYVDSTCIDCDQCRSTAPTFFRRSDEIGFSVVYRQPITETEIDLCMEAVLGCPTESIGRAEQD
jgi:ferredoxin